MKRNKKDVLSAIEDVANWRATMEGKLEKLPDEHPAYEHVGSALSVCWYKMESIDSHLKNMLNNMGIK